MLKQKNHSQRTLMKKGTKPTKAKPLHVPRRKIMSSHQQRQKLGATKPSTLLANRPQQPLNHFEVVKQPFSTVTTQHQSATMNDCDSGCIALDGTTPKCCYNLPDQSVITQHNNNIFNTPAKLIDPSTLSMNDCMLALRGKVLEVEGNIGCGKSTLTKMIAKILNNESKGIQDEVTVESLSNQDTTTTDIMSTANTTSTKGDFDPETFALLHGELVNQTFLSSFYANSQQYGFAFQMYMLTTRLFQMQTASFYAKNYGQFQLLDRGAVGDALFALYNASAGNISDEELNIYKSVCADRLPSSLSHKIDIVTFLDVSPLECFRRMNSMRQRDAEKEVVPDYLDGIDRSYFELMVKWLGHRVDACGGINVGLPPPIVVLDWSEFGCAKSVIQKLARASISHNQQIEYLNSIQHQYSGDEELDQIRATKIMAQNHLIRPEVSFIPTAESTPQTLNQLATTTTINIITTENDIELIYDTFTRDKQLLDANGQKVTHLVVDWALPHTNSYRRAIMKHIAREGKVTFFNSDHNELMM